jgi:RNA-directed DNA polymerase
VISPRLSDLYLNEVDKMLERAKEVTRNGKYTYIEYARFADDLVVLIDAYKRHDWLIGAVTKRLREEFGKLQVEINDEKSRTVDLGRGESFVSWVSTSATSAVCAGRCGRTTRPS